MLLTSLIFRNLQGWHALTDTKGLVGGRSMKDAKCYVMGNYFNQTTPTASVVVVCQRILNTKRYLLPSQSEWYGSVIWTNEADYWSAHFNLGSHNPAFQHVEVILTVDCLE